MGNPAILIDPLGAYSQHSNALLVETLGLLPGFIAAGDESKPAMEVFESAYMFGCDWMTEGRLDDDGTFQYPGDPALAPVGVMLHGDEQVIFYPYALVAVKHTDGTFHWCRMD